MRIGEIAKAIRVSRQHAWRLAKAGKIPNTRKTKGGHYYFIKTSWLTQWINYMKSYGKFRRNIMTEAYQDGYGGVRPAFTKEEQKLRHHLELALLHRSTVEKMIMDYDIIFEIYYGTTDDLINVISEIANWKECKLKRVAIRTNKSRLIKLRAAINELLNQQK